MESRTTGVVSGSALKTDQANSYMNELSPKPALKNVRAVRNAISSRQPSVVVADDSAVAR